MYLKMPNALLEMRLPPNALKVLTVLMSVVDNENKAVMRTCAIAQKCNVAMGTVCSAIKDLETRGLVRRDHLYKEDGTYAVNSYTVTMPVSRRWFALNLSEQILHLPASSFSVYAALLRFRGRNRKAFPSLFQLSSLLGLCKNTLLRAIRCLQSAGLVQKLEKWSGKHNLYLILGAKKERLVEQKPDARTKQLDSPSNTFTLTSVLHRVKRAVVHFLKSIPLPTLLHNRKKELLPLRA